MVSVRARPPASFSLVEQEWLDLYNHKEQLGLKMEPVKTAVDVMVVDHVERPTAN